MKKSIPKVRKTYPLKNKFSQETRDLFDEGGWARDWEDGTNTATDIHHILGRCSSSPYNACPLSPRNHSPEGRKRLPAIHSQEVQKKYLIKTKRYLDELGYKPTEVDLEFLETNKMYYDQVKSKNIRLPIISQDE